MPKPFDLTPSPATLSSLSKPGVQHFETIKPQRRNLKVSERAASTTWSEPAPGRAGAEGGNAIDFERLQLGI